MPAPPPLGEDAHLTPSEEALGRFCRPCNREFGLAAYFQHILTSPKHHRTCCKPCRRNFPSEKDRLLHWGTANAHRYTYDLWCNKNFDNPEAFLNHQRQSPQKHQVCELCNLDFGPNELNLKKHMDEVSAHKDAYDRLCQIPVESYDQSGKPTEHPICLLCDSNHLLPCHLAHTLEEFGFLNSLEHETDLSSGESSKAKSSNGPRSITEAADDVFDNPHAKSAIVEYTVDAPKLFLDGHQSPKNPTLNEVVERDQGKKWYCMTCKMDFGTKSLMKEHAVQHSPGNIACFGCHEEKKFHYISSMISHLESGNCSTGLTRSHINYLVAEYANSSAFLVKNSKLFFLAGTPTWVDVLQCPGPACKKGFNAFSALLQHVEMQHYQPITEGPMADILQYLKYHLGDSSAKEKPERIELDMNFSSGKLSFTTVSKDKALTQS